jgi:DNA-3-methyladenine glycosylase I
MCAQEADRPLAAGPDGLPRCWWSVGSPEYVAYHDQEWGRPQLSDAAIFEHLSLESFQAGLSWAVVLRKRAAFREAFAGFRPAVVAAFGPQDRERLLQDEGIVRNGRKIEAVIHNAGCALEVISEFGSLAAFFWGFRPKTWPAPHSRADLPAISPASQELAGELHRRGFQVLGPTTVHAHLQATGLVNDHMAGCCVREAVEAEQAATASRFARRP